MDEKTRREEVEEVCAQKLLRDHARYLRLMDSANTPWLEFYLGGQFSTMGWKSLGTQLLRLIVFFAAVSAVITRAGDSLWTAWILAFLILEVIRLNSRTEALSALREEFPNGWPLAGRKSVEPPVAPAQEGAAGADSPAD